MIQAIIPLASQYGRFGYRRITALLKRAGGQVGKDWVERIWRSEGLKVQRVFSAAVLLVRLMPAFIWADSTTKCNGLVRV
jgi:hypothetical protein